MRHHSALAAVCTLFFSAHLGYSQDCCITLCGTSCADSEECPQGQHPTCCNGPQGPNTVPCCTATPIIIDAFGEGFHLTNLTEGVKFRVLPSESPYEMSWTDQMWRNGWLVLDRNGNGKIDDFTELFGSFTAQPHSNDPNGYTALAVFDDPANGGNGNGVIDPDDSVYDHLRVWIDANHNGVSEPEELYSLRELGIFRIDLRYRISTYTDGNGNHFRYKARIWDRASRLDNACYDVLLEVKPHNASGE